MESTETSEQQVMAIIKNMAYNPENPPQYKSPDSENVYTVFARRVVGEDIQELGLSLDQVHGTLQIRFCVFADSQPEFKCFRFRFGSKLFVKYPLSQDGMQTTRTGCSLDRVDMTVVKSKRATAQHVIAALEADEGWDKLETWVSDALEAEGFKLLMEKGEFVQFMPKILAGVGLDAPVVSIKYPLPIKQPEAKPQPVESDDGEFGDDDEFGDVDEVA